MQTYTIRSGDTMWAIARRAKTTLEEIAKLNPQISDLSKISIGQVITLPDVPISDPSKQPSAPISTFLVQEGKKGAEDGPRFIVGTPNFAKDANTIYVRKIIHDEFGGGFRGDALQCTEYVQFKIAQNGVVIHWPADRPRDGGRWADIFEKNKLYRTLSEPKNRCAVSFTSGFSGHAAITGHVAYVEEVLPDGSIHITEANWPGDGKFNDRILKNTIWKDKYKCKFIDFF
jgi:hypothetical protein